MLTDSNFTARTNAFADLEATEGADLRAQLARLDAEKHDRRERHDREIEEARAMVAATALEIEMRIASDAKAALWPLAAAFPDAPRTTAGKFADAWRALDARSREQLGQPLSYRFACVAFAAAHDLASQCAAPSYFVFDGINPSANASVLAVKTICSGAVAVVVEPVLRDLELAIATKAPGYAPHPDRLEAMMSRASEAAQRVALADVDEAKAAADAAVASAIATGAWHAHEADEARQRDGTERHRASFAESVAGFFR